jgi:restriction system protein
MSIPGFQDLMLPLVRLASDGDEHSIRTAIDELADELQLTEDELADLLPSGRQRTFHNRVHWAKTFLTKAGLLEISRRGWFRITDRGRGALDVNPERIDMSFLDQYPEYVEWRRVSTGGGESKPSAVSSPAAVDTEHDSTPLEQIEAGYRTVRAELRSELKQLVVESDPTFFEQLVVDLLVAMGYGGSRSDAGRAIGRSGDGGIDGIIDEDRLGLDRIFVQAKRWQEASTVGRPEIQKFAGALQGERARKGIFMTSTSFSREAVQYAATIETRIVLIDGDRLADLMIDFNVGVAPAQSFEIKRIDHDFFTGI